MTSLRVLILEDSARDAELIVRELRSFGYDPNCTQVETEEDFRAHVNSDLDLILADYTLPQFDALGALQILQQQELSIPFIIVTGTITEETAVAVLKQGADDFLLKDRLARLGPAVASALEQRRLRDERKRAQELLIRSEARFRRLVTRMSALVIELDPRGTILFVNDSVSAVTGFTPDEIQNRNAFDLFFPGEARGQLEGAAQILSRGEDLHNYVTRCPTNDGAWISLEWTTANDYRADGRLQKIIAFGLDVTEREKAAARIRQLSRLYAAISNTNEALVRSKNPDEVFAAVCRACVDYGGFKLAWVGLADDEMQRIVVAQAYGIAIEALYKIPFRTDAGNPVGRGPTAIAYRENRVNICDDFANDPAVAPWREEVTRFGFVASIALPIRQGGKPIGTLSAYGGEQGTLDQEAVLLLERMVENISFAMDQFEGELQRQRLQDQRAADVLRLAELSRRVVAVQEQERRQLAGELHDRTSPTLSAVALNLGMIAADLAPNLTPALDSRLADTRALLSDAMAGIRDVCADLRPVTLDYSGLARALQQYAEMFSQRTGIAVEVSCTDPEKRLAPGTESALFRIAQEALTNCAKHSKASAIQVDLVYAADRSQLTISDDGGGFDADALGRSEQRQGLGLLTMRERAEFAGGKFTLESRPGHGTRISVVI